LTATIKDLGPPVQFLVVASTADLLRFGLGDFMDTSNILSDLRTERDHIDQAIAALEALHNSASPEPKTPKGGTSFGFGANKPQPTRRTSAAGRRRISGAAKARWAREKGDAKAVATPTKPKRHMSAAGRARIIAATKARWAKFNAAKAAKEPVKKAKVMSPAARRKIAAAAKARWAKIRAAKG